MRVTITPEPPLEQQAVGAETNATPQPASRDSHRPVQDLGERLRALIAGVARLLAASLAPSQRCPRCRAPSGEYADVSVPREYGWDAPVGFHCRVCGQAWEESTWYNWWWD
ncbi:MAG TPA: hypothetical protein VJA25_12050 [Dehalococcoidia bacterium]|nr:hypothetical protein [Dehalococcoidia bacterium]